MEQGGARERPARPARPALSTTNTNTDRSTAQTLQKIKQFHDEAHLYVRQGLTCDEQGQGEQALVLYTKGVRCIDNAFDLDRSINITDASHLSMIEKMKRTKQQIQSRVENLLQNDAAAARAVDDPPPSYEESQSPTNTVSSPMDFALGESLLSDNIGEGQSGIINGTELFKIQDGVQIYFITPEGYVSAPTYPSSLAIYRLDGQILPNSRNQESPPAFLKVGDWTYPLLPGRSPVLQSDWASYIFPDVNAADGSAVGVIIPDSVDEAERRRLESYFTELTALRSQIHPVQDVSETSIEWPEEEEGERTSTKISKGIVTAAEWIALGLNKGAEKTGQLFRDGSTKLQQRIQPEDKPREIDPMTQKGVYYARQATGAAVKVSGYLVTQLGRATVAIGREIAPHVRQQGEKYFPQVFKGNAEGRSKVDSVVEVAAGGIQGFSTVYVGLEEAAKILAKNVADGTVGVVQHKYGPQAGELTENALYSAGHLALTTNNVRNFGMTAMAKRVATDTGKAVVDDYQKDAKVLKKQDQNDGSDGACSKK